MSIGGFFLPGVPNLFVKGLAKITNFGLVPLIFFFGGYALGVRFPTRLADEVMLRCFLRSRVLVFYSTFRFLLHAFV